MKILQYKKWLCLLVFANLWVSTVMAQTKTPNIVLVYVDDMGFNDLACYGAKDPGIKTPNIDRLAAKGVRFTNYLSASSVCAPSRAALLTGRYPQRSGLPVCPGPDDRPGFEVWNNYVGLPLNEITIAEMLKTKGYATAAYGKWHLGKFDGFGPRQQGFDEYIGRLHNFHVGKPGIWYHNEEPQGEIMYHQAHQKLTDATLNFMTEQHKKQKPFFVYLSHYLVHGPWSPNKEFCTDEEWASYKKTKGKMNAKVYPALVRELDHHIGLLLQKIEELNIDKETLVIFAADNGPWLPAGSADPFAGGKYFTLEGGQRVPAMVSWPGQIPSGQVSNEMVSALDIFPTIAAITNNSLPTGRKIDGFDLMPLLSGKVKKSPRDEFAYYNGLTLEAVRKGDWKLHLPRDPKVDGNCVYWVKKRSKAIYSSELYNLKTDKSEHTAVENIEKYKELNSLAKKYRAELGDWNKSGNDTYKSNYPGTLNTIKKSNK